VQALRGQKLNFFACVKYSHNTLHSDFGT
jgi:hypothetical protein